MAAGNLKEGKTRIIGVVLNNFDIVKQGYYYHKYYYSYYYYGKEGRAAKSTAETDRAVKDGVPASYEPVAAIKPEKKDLFIPNSSTTDIKVVPPPSSSGEENNIITMLTEEEKHRAGSPGTVHKDSSLGRRPAFFEEDKDPAPEKKAGQQNKDSSGGLGKKDMFKDL